MSSTEYWSGNLRKIEFSIPNLSWDDKLRCLMDMGWKLDIEQCEENEYIEESGWFDKKSTKPFLKVLNGEIYEIFDYHCSYDYDDSDFSIFDNADGSIHFIGSFHNGGTDLIEQLERVIKDHTSTINLWSKTYCGEDLGDIGNDIEYYLDKACQNIPDDGGIPLGKFTVTLNWSNDGID
jgi:hypothetical protein